MREGRAFFKMSGSGNDFVVVDARTEDVGELGSESAIRAVCARRTGVGADGIVFLEPSHLAAFRMRYLNSDGSPAALCGNAALCVARLAVELGAAPASGFTFDSEAGAVHARLIAGVPEIDLEPVRDVNTDAAVKCGAGERRIGFAVAGVPHLVVRCDDVALADVHGRGATLRRHRSLPNGANVNFVSRDESGWRVRTFERGVEGETLACGTGAVATAILLAAWDEGAMETALLTASGHRLQVRLEREGGLWRPRLSGEARLVFRGTLAEV